MSDYSKAEAAFAEQLEWFIRMYAPRDRHDERDFTRDTYLLLSFATRVAQQPLLDKMATVMAAQPMPNIFIKSPETLK